MAKMEKEAAEILAEAVQPDKTLVHPPGEAMVMPTIRPLTRDDANLAGLVATPMSSVVDHINIIQHEFAPLVRRVNDSEWRQLAKDGHGVNWRIIQQQEVMG